MSVPCRVITTRPRCPCGAATVVPGTSKLFARTLPSPIVRHKLIIKKRNSCVDRTELFCRLCCCVILGAHLSVWPTAGSVPSSPSGPSKELSVGMQLPTPPAGAARECWTHRWQWGMSGARLRRLSWWPCCAEGSKASWLREKGLPWPNAPSFAQKMDSEAVICITPLTVQSQGTCHFLSMLPACSGVRNSLVLCLHN